MSGQITPEKGQSKSVGTGDGSAHWCWTSQEDAEIWHCGGKSREEAIAAAKHDATLEPQPNGFWIAPTTPATQAEVDEYWGDEEVEIGSPMIDVNNIEHFPPNGRDEGRAGSA